MNKGCCFLEAEISLGGACKKITWAGESNFNSFHSGLLPVGCLLTMVYNFNRVTFKVLVKFT